MEAVVTYFDLLWKKLPEGTEEIYVKSLLEIPLFWPRFELRTSSVRAGIAQSV
jgi:hypothetical protein